MEKEGRLRLLVRKMRKKIKAIGLNNKDFTIVSNNCWGGFVYKNYDLEYQTPFVNLFIQAPCYIKLLENFDELMKAELNFIDVRDSKYFELLKNLNMPELGQYPIGVLNGEVEIHFLHYKTPEEAVEKWNSRKKRINKDNMLVKFSDSETSTPDLIRTFDRMPFKHKVCFTAKAYDDCQSVVCLPEFRGKDYVKFEWLTYKKHYNIKKVLNSLILNN